MADIELVIKIPEEIWEIVKNGYVPLGIGKYLKNGIPLPKRHGKIGDLDALRKEVSSWGMNDYEPSDFIDEIDRADTIIEADTPKIRKGTPLEENDSGYNCENWIP